MKEMDVILTLDQHYKKYFLPSISVALERVGSEFDGGYLIPSLVISTCKKVMCFGIGLNFDFEKDFLIRRSDMNLIMVDYSSRLSAQLLAAGKFFLRHSYHHGLPAGVRLVLNRLQGILALHSFIRKRGVTFLPKYLKSRRTSSHELSPDQLFNGDQSRTVVKMDIEGDEYDILVDHSSRFLSVDCLVIEFHDVSRKRYMYCLIVERLLERFHLVHCSINNGEGYYLDFPNCVELTLLSRRVIEAGNVWLGPLHSPFHHYDSKNDPKMPDVRLHF